PLQIHSYLFLATQPPPKPTFFLPSPAILPLIEVVVTHPAGGTMASNFIPMHLPETCALRVSLHPHATCLSPPPTPLLRFLPIIQPLHHQCHDLVA
ncbi:hypothetical protein JOQ06_007551, partial [Pogonophryne albipinna]